MANARSPEADMDEAGEARPNLGECFGRQQKAGIVRPVNWIASSLAGVLGMVGERRARRFAGRQAEGSRRIGCLNCYGQSRGDV
jgi:hypothetical protein